MLLPCIFPVDECTGQASPTSGSNTVENNGVIATLKSRASSVKKSKLRGRSSLKIHVWQSMGECRGKMNVCSLSLFLSVPFHCLLSMVLK